MIPPSRAICVALMLLGATGVARAAVNLPQLEEASAKEVARQLKLDGERSLREKLKVGAERYQERRAFREGLVSAMRTNTEVRRIAISGQLAATPGVSPKPSNSLTRFAWVGVLVVVALGAVLKRRFYSLAEASNLTEYQGLRTGLDAPNLRTDEEVMTEFIASFKTGLTAPVVTSPTVVTSAPDHEPINMFIAKAPEILGELRKLLQKISATANEADRQAMFTALQQGLNTLRTAAGLPQCLPVWQLATAMEGLVKQLTHIAGSATPSTLRTFAGGLDFLQDLCVTGARPDLFTHPPIRLLAVDDDLICRKAVSYSLKKALSLPDLAENGETALALAGKNAYDVIFLDVQMPGMDGYEVCRNIRETLPNAKTPVVFVTVCSDFEGRAQSILSGGNGLIAKPFLTFEITVKALTFARQRAGQSARSDRPVTQPNPNGSTAHSPALARTGPAQNRLLEPIEDSAKACFPEMLSDDHSQSQLFISPAASDGMASSLPTREFLTCASARLEPLRDLMPVILQTTDEPARQRMLADFSVRLSDLGAKGHAATGHPVLRLVAAVEGLVHKLLQKSKDCTSSTLLTISTALDLVQDLCATHVKPDMATNPPVRIMAVDDDPLAHRAITCALQMAFEKPEGADSGEAALALATARPFDVIFMDVTMPGMDGFTACSAIHETEQNRTTPVVFVTYSNDFETRSQATASGGSDFIAKPFLTAEITLKALTYALRGRLEQLQTAHNVTRLSAEAEPEPDDLVPALA